MLKFCLVISCFLLLSISNGYAQGVASLPKLEPSYFEDFKTYPSYPFQCLHDVFIDKYGKMWLEPCSSVASSHSINLYQFDGYSFISKEKLFKGLPDNITFDGLNNEGKLIAHTHIDSLLVIIELDTYTEKINLIKLNNQEYDVEFLKTEDGAFYFVQKDKGEIIVGVLKEGKISYIYTYPTDRKGPSIFFHIDGENLIVYSVEDDLGVQILSLETNKKDKIDGLESRDHFVDFDVSKLRMHGNEDVSGGTRVIIPEGADLYEYNIQNQVFEYILSGESDWEYFNSYGDDSGNWLYIFLDNENKLKGILEDKNGKLYNYSAFFEKLDQIALEEIRSENFKEEVFIFDHQGIYYQKVKAIETIDQYLKEVAIRSMIELENDVILVITQRRELFLLKLNEESIEEVDWFPEDFDISSTSFLKAYGKGKIIGNSNEVFIIYDYFLKESQIIPFQEAGIISFIHYDDDQLIVLGRDFSLYLFDLQTKERILITDQIPEFSSKFIDKMHFDKKSQDVWIATTPGLIKVNIASKKLIMVNEQIAFENNRFLSLHVDDNNKFWLGSSSGGIEIFDPASGEVKKVDSELGLPNNTIPFIVADDDGDRWVGTYNGLGVLNKEGEPLFNLNVENGLSNREFNRLSYLKTRSGKLLLGTIKGLNVIDPILIKNSISKKGLKIYLVNLLSYNLENSLEKDRILIAEENQRITLSPSKRNLQIDFALSNYYKSSLNQYSYRLKGVYNEWVSIGNQHSLGLTNLPAGKYELQIRGRDALGEWTKEPLRIPIDAKEYFYKQTWFYILSILLVITAIFGIAYSWIQGLRSQVKKATEKIREDKEIIEQQAQELLELDKAKSRFFTNISHEFRTPLTVILGMAKKMVKHPDQWQERGGAMIIRNGNNILNLVNQILDLRKLESGKLELNMIQGNIITYLIYVFESFSSLAESNQIGFQLKCDVEEVMMDYDREKLLRVLSNLLSNAIKFTPEGGDVSMIISQEENSISIRVKDTGIGIPANRIDRVFDQFYQVDTSITKVGKGTGIGLALSKELVQLMGGQIEVESTEDEGSAFTFHLPIQQNAPLLDENEWSDDQVIIEQVANIPTAISNENIQDNISKEDRPQILLVEDNEDVLQYLIACLKDQYDILTAANGQEGIDKAITFVPDLIVSDVMMPIKTGFELCDILKTDERTSHIPIILLTAKAGENSKLSGLSKGADSYLTKPFNEQELLIRINNLIEARKKLQVYFQKIESTTTDQIESVDQEHEVLQKIRLTLEAHIGEEDFGIEQLCRKVGMSRTQVHRKIKALTGQSTSHYLRRIRLNKAKELLKNTELNITQVAYEVGFNYPSYFTTSFVDEFGVSPNKIRKKL